MLKLFLNNFIANVATALLATEFTTNRNTRTHTNY